MNRMSVLIAASTVGGLLLLFARDIIAGHFGPPLCGAAAFCAGFVLSRWWDS